LPVTALDAAVAFLEPVGEGFEVLPSNSDPYTSRVIFAEAA
jgi:hypothetical protein